MIDYALQRKNMVESQIRPSDVTDRRVIRAMQTVPRELFVPEAVRGLAYMDDPVPLAAPGSVRNPGRGPSRQLMSPRTFAKLLVLAEIKDSDRVLVVGSATGYSAAVVAEIAASVVALESDPALVASASGAIREAALSSASKIEVVSGVLPDGHVERAPYDVVVIEGSIELTPSNLLQQLAPAGRCVAIVQQNGVGLATLWRKIGERVAAADAFEATAARLQGFEKPRAFAL